VKFFIAATSSNPGGRGGSRTVMTLSDHWLLPSSWKATPGSTWWDNLCWAVNISHVRNTYQTNYTSCQWEHCCKRITFRILEIVSLPFHKQFFQWGMTLSRPAVHFSCCTAKCTFLCCAKSSILYCFSHTKWSDNLLEIILTIHLLVLKK